MSSVNVCTQAQLDAAMDAIWGDLEARYNTIEDVKARLTLELWGVPAPVASPVAEPLKIKVPKETKVKLTKEERSAAAKARYAALSDEDKAKFIVDEVKKAIRESPLSDEQKTQLVTWCDVALPYVIEAVKIVKAEVGKVANVALAEVKKCCPSWFSSAKKAAAPPA